MQRCLAVERCGQGFAQSDRQSNLKPRRDGDQIDDLFRLVILVLEQGA